MIFITVGTHEQPFNRLLRYMDRYIDETKTKEWIVCQSGYSTYIPKNYKTEKFTKFEQMQDYLESARIVITHGGPSSFIPVLAKGRIPIVVPREKIFNEHVNDHQKDFCRKVNEEKGQFILCTNYEEFRDALLNYEKRSKIMQSGFKPHNAEFCKELDNKIEELL